MNNLDGVMVVGLTGQTGSGKTTTCKIFRENGKFETIDFLLANTVPAIPSPARILEHSITPVLISSSVFLSGKP